MNRASSEQTAHVRQPIDRLGFATVLAGAGLCLLGCALPVVGGVSAGVLVGASGVLERLGVGLAIAGGLWVTFRWIVNRRSVWAGRSGSQNCDCLPAPSVSTTEGPLIIGQLTSSAEIACTLDAPDLVRRMAAFRGVFARAYVGTDRLAEGFRWRFQSQEGLWGELTALARNEQECCRFFEFRLIRQEEQIWWETRAPPTATAVLEAFARLPQQVGGIVSMSSPS